MKGGADAFKNIRETFEGTLAQQFKLTGGEGEPLMAPSFVVKFTASTLKPEEPNVPSDKPDAKK